MSIKKIVIKITMIFHKSLTHRLYCVKILVTIILLSPQKQEITMNEKKSITAKNPSLLISELVNYGIGCGLIGSEDRAFVSSALVGILRLTEHTDTLQTAERPLNEILGDLCDYAYRVGIIEENGVVYRDLFDTALMGVMVDRPSNVNKTFYSLYKESPSLATDYFYKLSCDSNYIRTDRIKRDLKWKHDSEFGEIDVTVNLSKPEKDPKAIAAAKLAPQSGYPLCLLCHENEGYVGSLTKPARQNLRQIPFKMAGADWFLQYSPYVYYNEHCIALCGEHVPMKIDRSTFEKLLGFVECFPHYFIGSNADLPIVGGSILSHDHMQGGRYTFAMERAECEAKISFKGFTDVEAQIVKWPLSVIRLKCKDKGRLVELADRILTVWRGYTDADAEIYAKTDDTPHNTITPIARRDGELFVLDLTLRNNITTEEHPLGLYHPHREHHNVKKENIGLIEVMGLAVLPARLKDEIEIMSEAILSGTPFSENPVIEKHASWFDAFKNNYSFTEENVTDILKAEIAKTFVRVLCDAGVYKCTAEGRSAFMRFIDAVNAL